MYISEVYFENFRSFGSEGTTIRFNEGLNLLVGANDAGKTAILDGIKIVLGSTDFNWYRIQESDFYNENLENTINIRIKFSNLNFDEKAAFIEYTTKEEVEGSSESEQVMYINWTCYNNQNMSSPRMIVRSKTGEGGLGLSLEPELKELLRVTYLKALRDATRELQSGRNSRLSQVFQSVPNINSGEEKHEDGDILEDLSLSGIFNLTNSLIKNYEPLENANTKISNIIKNELALTNEEIQTQLEVSKSNTDNEKFKVSKLLEKLDLKIDKENTEMKGNPGLGTNNLISMAVELLLQKNNLEESYFLLVEEPEAHIHAQRQLKIVKSLQRMVEDTNTQIIMTTHSPLVSSVINLENIIMLQNSTAYSLASDYTLLEEDDYEFLERFLDATKANLFFANNIIIVEGTGEELLLPTIANLLDKDFTDFGVSVVNVGGVGLSRYSKIFQRSFSDVDDEINPDIVGDNQNWIDIKVACVTDRDIMPNIAPRYCIDSKYETEDFPEKNNRKWQVENDFSEIEAEIYLNNKKEVTDGQNVKTFISNDWTLEYDLAFYGLEDSTMKKCLINALVKSHYAVQNVEKNVKSITEEIDELLQEDIVRASSFFYSHFSKSNFSKGAFSQYLAQELENSFINDSSGLIKVLPSYIIKSIGYVTEALENE